MLLLIFLIKTMEMYVLCNKQLDQTVCIQYRGFKSQMGLFR